MSLRVVALITAKQDKIDETKAVLTGFVAPTRKESGCIVYDLCQDHSDPAKFAFIEEWTDEAALDAHLKTPHISAGLAKMPELLDGDPDIRRYTQIA